MKKQHYTKHELERKNKHLENLEKLGFIKSKWNMLQTFEKNAHRLAEQWCNGDIDEQKYDKWCARISLGVAKLFRSGLPNGFFINGDCRGYALKIRDEVNKKLRDQNICLYSDWGGYGILAPEDFN